MTEFHVEWLLKGDPRPVQIEALARSYYGFKTRDHKDEEPEPQLFRNGPARGWMHLLEMRLGKTPTTLNEMALFRLEHNLKNGVLFAPNTYKEAWAAEAEKFGVGVPFHVFESHKRAKILAEYKKHGGVLVVNYEAAQHKAILSDLEEAIRSVGPFMGVMDESIRIKNYQSTMSKNARDLFRIPGHRAGAVRLLTGLPYTQGPHELYPQLRAVGQQEGVTPPAFKRRFCQMGGYKNKAVKGVQNEEDLKRILGQCSWTAKRVDWTNARTPEYVVEQLTLLPEQIKVYNDLETEFLSLMEDGSIVTAAHVMGKMMKQQQASTGFVIDEEGKPHWLIEPRQSPKLLRTLDIVENSPKTVVLYHYNETGDMLLRELDRFNPAQIRSQDRMKKDGLNVEDEKQRFNTDPGCRVIVAQLERTKYGHDLTGSREHGVVCGHEIFYENTYSLDTRTQVEQRIVEADPRISPMYMDFLGGESDKAFIRALQAKESLIIAVMGDYGYNRYGD